MAKQLVPTTITAASSSSGSGSSSSRRHEERGKGEGTSPSWLPESISSYSKNDPMIKTTGGAVEVEVEVARNKVENRDLETEKIPVLRNNDNYNHFNLYSRNMARSDNERDNDNDYDAYDDVRKVTSLSSSSSSSAVREIKTAVGSSYTVPNTFREEKALVSGTFDTSKLRKSGDFSIYAESSSIGRAGSKSDERGGGGLGYTMTDTPPIIEQKVRTLRFIPL